MLNLSLISSAHSAFEIFHLSPSFDLNLDQIEDLYYDYCKQVHPDRLTDTSSHEITAKLNKAFQTLKNKESRLEALLLLAGHDFSEGKTQKSSTPNPEEMELAEEFFELQELKMEDAPELTPKAASFSKKIENMLSESTTTIYSLAKQTNWKDFKSSESEQNIGKILNLRKTLNYLHSLQSNLSRLLGGAS